MLGWLLVFSVLLAGLFGYLVLFDGSIETIGGLPTAAAVAFALLALYAVATRSLSDGGSWRRLAAPFAVTAALIAGGYWVLSRADISGVMSRLALSTQTQQGAPEAGGLKSVRIRRNEAGQFIARGEINGTPVQFLIDTGSSGVVLRQSEAERAGIDTKSLSFTVPLKTANGETHVAAVRVRTLAIGPLRLEGVEALVAEPGSLNENLLGMSFLRRLRSYELTGDFMTLRE